MTYIGSKTCFQTGLAKFEFPIAEQQQIQNLYFEIRTYKFQFHNLSANYNLLQLHDVLI